MLKSWLSWINLTLIALIMAFILLAAGIMFMRTTHIPAFEGPIQTRVLPPSSLSLEQSAFDAISTGALVLEFSPLSIQLPDLKKILVYYGKNGRPDVMLQAPMLHFSFLGNKAPTPILPEQRVYIRYDKLLAPPQYVFSVDNQQTPLWIEVSPLPNQVNVKVAMVDEQGHIITKPASNAQFVLTEKEYARPGGHLHGWEIGKMRVDGTLLARQKARWYGTDKFMEQHGGPEFNHLIDRQRIDVGEGSDVYSIYLNLEDMIIWDGQKWKVVEPGMETAGSPLMTIKKIDDRLLTLELWDVEGKAKVTLNILKSTEAWVPQNLQQAFKFVGARTRSQFLFEVNKERMVLSPHDWLLLIDGNWKKLVMPQDIDAYVERKITGPLFIFDAVEKREDRQYFIGTLYNSARTEVQKVEILMQKNGKAETSKSSEETKREALLKGRSSSDMTRSKTDEGRN